MQPNWSTDIKLYWHFIRSSILKEKPKSPNSKVIREKVPPKWFEVLCCCHFQIAFVLLWCFCQLNFLEIVEMEVSFNNAINDTFDKDVDFQLGLQEEHDHEPLQDHQEQEEIERDPDSGRQIPAAGPSRYPVGSLVWAKLPDYSYWPAVVTLPDMTIASNRQKIESGIIHIHFFGYDDDVSFNFFTSI